MSLNILVTGGQGFIGSHLIEHLLHEGHKVVSLDRTDHGNLDHVIAYGESLKTLTDEITEMDSADWRDLFFTHRIDGVIHLAGLLGTAELTDQLPEALRVNVLAVLPLYDAIVDTGVRAVQIAVGNPTWHNTYSITKTTTERIALMYNDIQGTKIAVVRAMNVYGPRQKWEPIRKVVPYFAMRAICNDPIEIFGTGDQLIDLIHVTDTVKILAKALIEDHDIYERIFDAGSGEPIKVKKLAEMIRKHAGSKSEIVYVPMRNGEPLNSVTMANVDRGPDFANPKKTEFIDLKRGIRSTVSWYGRFHSELRQPTRQSQVS